MKRILALLLTGALVFSNASPMTAQASEVTQNNVIEGVAAEEDNGTDGMESDQNALVEDKSTQDDVSLDQNNPEQDAVDNNAGDQKSDPNETKDDSRNEEQIGNNILSDSEENSTAPEMNDNLSEEETLLEEESKDAEAPELNYVYLDYAEFAPGEEQNIVVSAGDDETIFEKAVLSVAGENGIKTIEAQNIVGNAALFTDVYSADEEGTYTLTEVEFVVDGNSFAIDLQSGDMNPVQYRVAEPDSGNALEIVSLDDDGNATAAASIEDAIQAAEKDVVPGEDDDKFRSANGQVVVVLDPGHDSKHLGAHQSGLKEEDLNLKIAQYCKTELEKYNGVKVYMTRSGSGCPYPGTSSTDDNRKRVEYAKSVGADVYVSIHLNSSSSGAANGAEVYYPNSHYISWIGTEGKDLAGKVSAKLAELGLYNRGITIRNSQDGTKYADGSLADYYAVIRRSKELGFPGIIVEHAFMTNASDVSKFLSSDAGLQKLGIADAEGIAKYFGLIKGPVDFKISGLKISDMNALNGDFTVSLTGVTPAESVDKINMYIWSSKDGQDDLKVYSFDGNTTGTYTFTDNIKNHKNDTGIYNIHVYATDKGGNSKMLGSTTCDMTYKPLGRAVVTAVKKDAQQKQFVLSAAGVADAVSLRFAVWNTSNTNNIKWYSAVKDTNGKWNYTVPVSDFKQDGTYCVHVYAVDNGKKETFAGGTTFSVEGPKATGITVSNKDYSLGKMKVTVSGVTSPAGIQSVKAAVWTQSDMKDLKWYEASKEAEGVYSYWVDISNHNNNYGTYIMHVYLTDGNGIYKYGTGLRENLEKPQAAVSAVINAPNTWFTITARNFPQYGGVKSVKAAVWSAENGQDDLKWYDLGKQTDGSWQVPVPVSYHKSKGLYYAHVYVENLKGSKIFIGGDTFTVAGASADVVECTDQNNINGTFDIRVAGIKSYSGVAAVDVAVWSQDNQSDMKWYSAKWDGGQNWNVHADIANHGYNYGTYRVHVYITGGNGVRNYVGGTRVTINLPHAEISSSVNSSNTWFAIYAKNIRIPSGVKNVKVGVWSEKNGQDDLKWYNLGKNSDGNWSVPVPVSYHKTEGKYDAHVYVEGNNGMNVFIGSTSFEIKGPSASGAEVTNQSSLTSIFTVVLKGVNSPSGISSVSAGVWKDGKSDVKWYNALNAGNGNYYVTVNAAEVGNGVGRYNVHFYATDGNGISKFVKGLSHTIEGYSIMGFPQVNVQQMVNYYNANATYPSYYANTEVPTIEAFCQMYAEEAGAEGVRVEVAFCQAMKETGFLRYGGDVDISQYNFAGIGATGNGARGNAFSSPREGVRAQIQHLKAYASTDDLVLGCVDPRFKYVRRGTAPYVEWLGIRENPNGTGWATAVGYGNNIVQRIKNLKTY